MTFLPSAAKLLMGINSDFKRENIQNHDKSLRQIFSRLEKNIKKAVPLTQLKQWFFSHIFAHLRKVFDVT